MNRISKIFLLGLAVVALAGFGKIGTTNAAATPGSLIKMNGLSSVYYLGQDGKRYVFPAQNIYFSWYKDFSGVVTISQSELESYPLGANITMRPGTRLVKITTNPKVYAVEPGGNLRAIPDEATAKALYGDNWNKRVSDVADAFFTNYKMGNQLASNEVPAGSLVKNAGNASVYYFDGTNYRSIANEAAFNANRFSFDNVMTISNTITAGGTAIVANEFANPDASATGVGVIPGQGTGLTVALSASTPASTNVPMNGIRVTFTKINLTASSDGAMNVSSIKAHRIGLSSKGHFDQVWAEKNGVRLTSKRSVNSDDEALLTFVPALNIPAGQTISVDLVASLRDAQGTGGLSVNTASDITTTNSATISGSFPVNGNLMSFTTYNVTEAWFESTPTGATTVKVGDEDAELAGFQLKATGSKAIILKSLTLKNTANADLSQVTGDLYIEHSGTKITDAATVVDKNVTFVFSNGGFQIDRNESEIFKIKGDIIDSDTSNDTITLKIDNKEDFVVVEANTEFGSPVRNLDGTGYAEDSNALLRKATIEAGAVTISKKTTSPVDANYVRGTKNITALIANVKADQAIKAESLNVTIDTSTDSLLPYIENMKVYVNNTLLDSIDPSDDATAVNYSTQVDLNAGDNEIKVVYDINSETAADGKDLIVKLVNTNLLDSPEYVASGDTVRDIQGTATGAKISTASASLTATRSDGYSDGRTVVKGTEEVSLGKITVKATNDVVKVTSIAIASTTDNTVNPNNIYDMKLYVNDSQIGNTRDWTSSGATFSSLNLEIAKDRTKVIELRGSFDNSASSSEYFKAAFTFTAEDSNGKTVSSNVPTTVKFDITDSGSLTVTKSADTPNPAILVANTSNNSVAKFRLSSSNDITKVTEIYMSNLKGSDADARISEVRLMNGTTVLDTDVPVSGEVHFTIPTGSLNIEKDGNVTVDVQVSLNQIADDSETDKAIEFVITKVKATGSNGSELDATHNNTIEFDDAKVTLSATITASDTSLTVSANTIATGSIIKIGSEQMFVTTGASTTLTVVRGVNGTSAAAHNNSSAIDKVAGIDSTKEFRVRKTVPTVALVALPTETLGVGSKTLAKFTVTAGANEDVNIKTIKLNVTTSTGITLGSWQLKVNGDVKTLTDTDFSDGISFDTGSPEVVGAASTKTFEVIATVGGLVNDNYNYVSTKINEAASYSASGDFEWNDNASNDMSTWFNSYRVIGLPTNTQQLDVNL